MPTCQNEKQPPAGKRAEHSDHFHPHNRLCGVAVLSLLQAYACVQVAQGAIGEPWIGEHRIGEQVDAVGREA